MRLALFSAYMKACIVLSYLPARFSGRLISLGQVSTLSFISEIPQRKRSRRIVIRVSIGRYTASGNISLIPHVPFSHVETGAPTKRAKASAVV